MLSSLLASPKKGEGFFNSQHHQNIHQSHSPNKCFFGYRWDRYESKQLFWVEEDMKAEWEKTTSKSRRSEAEYQTNVASAQIFGSSLEGITFGPPSEGRAQLQP